MTSGQDGSNFTIGDAVLATINGAQFPGVVEDTEEDRVLVRVAQPMRLESGDVTDSVWLSPNQLDRSLNEESSGQQALPS